MLNLSSEDFSRFILCGLNFEISTEQILITATDGRLLGILKSDALPVFDGEAQKFSVTIASEFLSIAVGEIPRREEFYCADCDEDKSTYIPESELQFTIEAERFGGDLSFPVSVTIERSGVEFKAKAIEALFPNWRKIIPATFENGPVIVSSVMLERFEKLRENLSPGNLQIRFRGGANKNQPYHVELHGIPNFFGILMGMRDDREESDIATPAWLNL